ncbi:hypothetical protein NHX12_023144 [Muraenolepis orangiensis]|uniref:Chromosomal protein D1 n=1 Tax=Muraenolepis orangiensis TaxID=630683 RepID=A0A9Q0EQ63_9TELE|nr:hypothetical protein NHX12_023144 [Muraenolepis orangiensis]
MEEEIAVEGQGDSGSIEGESGVDIPTKRARGRPKLSKELQVLVTRVDPSEFGSGISNGGPTLPLRSRGRPKGSLKKQIVQKDEQDSLKTPRGRGRPKGSGWKKLAGPEESPRAGQSIGKASPSKKTLSKLADEADDWDCTASGSITPKKGRGRPKGTFYLKHNAESSQPEEEEAGDSSPRQMRERPEGSPNKKPLLAEKSGSKESESEGDSSSDGQSPAKRGRPKKELHGGGGGRPRKNPLSPAGDLIKRGRGRPKKKLGRGRPRNLIKSVEAAGEASGEPKVRMPVGRPRKYPRVDPPESLAPVPRKGRGRPDKSEIMKKNLKRVLNFHKPSVPNDESPRPSGHPKGTVKDSPLKKRGSPKGSPNKSEAVNQTLVEDKVDHEAGHAEQEGEEKAEDDPGETDNDIGPCEEGENSAEKM